MSIQKQRTIMKSSVSSKLSLCPLIWMFHSRLLNYKINYIHEKALKITYQNNTSLLQTLLNKDNSASINHKNLQLLATEMFKIHRGLFPKILRETFVSKTSLYNLRKNHTIEKRQAHSVYDGTELLSFLGSKIWDLVPVELKQSESLDFLKLKIGYLLHVHEHGTIVRTGITCKKIPCYMRDSACRWFMVKKAKIF